MDSNNESLHPTFNAVAQTDGYGCVKITATFTAPTKDGWIASSAYDWFIFDIPGMANDEDLGRVEEACKKTIGYDSIRKEFAEVAASISGEDYNRDKSLSRQSERLLRLHEGLQFSVATFFNNNVVSIFRSSDMHYPAAFFEPKHRKLTINPPHKIQAAI